MCDVCINCGDSFSRRPNNKGYKKFNLSKVCSPTTSKAVFKRENKGNICDNCYGNLKDNTLCKRNSNKRTVKRFASSPTKQCKAPKRLDTKSTPIKLVDVNSPPTSSSDPDETPSSTQETTTTSVSDVPSFSPTLTSTPKTKTRNVEKSSVSSKSGFCEQAVNYIRSSKYLRAFTLLVSNSSAAKNAFIEVSEKLINDEISTVSNGCLSTFCGPVKSTSDIEAYDWKRSMDEVREKMPLLYTTVSSALPPPSVFAQQVAKGRRGARR